MQDDPASDGDLAFQLSSQTSSSHSQLTVDLPVNILQVRPFLMPVFMSAAVIEKQKIDNDKVKKSNTNK